MRDSANGRLDKDVAPALSLCLEHTGNFLDGTSHADPH